MGMTDGGKKLRIFSIAGILIAILVFYGTRPGHFLSMDSIKQVFQKKVELTNAAPLSSIKSAPMAPIPSDKVVATGDEYRIEVAKWNSQAGAIYANGGIQTTEGSLMYTMGITNLKFIVQDNFNFQVNDLVAYMREWKASGGNPKKGCQFISLMLDGSPFYLQALVNELTSMGLHPKGYVSWGKSDGEDGFWGPKSWSKALGGNPKNMKGGVAIWVLFDGDGNDGLKYAADNDVIINPNIKTYDNDMLNIIPAQDDDFLKAVDQYNNGVTEEREISHNGKLTGKKIRITTDKSKSKTSSFTIAETTGVTLYVESGVATWMPGDNRIATGKGGLVPLATTAEYYWQMPQFLITTKEWAEAHHDVVKKIIKASLQGGAQVKVHDKALYKACELEAKLYNGTGEEKKAEFWYRNFKRHEIKDTTGVMVLVGGSMNFSIEDNIVAFGLEKHDGGPAKSSYTVFGDKLAELWPEKMKAYPPFDEIFDPIFLDEIAKESTIDVDMEQKPKMDGAPIREVMSSSSKAIEFQTGRAELTPAGRKAVKKIYNEINTAQQKVLLVGHADGSGTHDHNMNLSRDRAKSTMEFLISLGYSRNLIDTDAKGDTELADPQHPAAAINRRVVIVTGK